MRPLALAVALVAAAPLAQPVDSLATPAPPAGPVIVVDSTGQSPRGAVLRALAVPGWGQVYNGQWLKAPVAAGGVVAAAVYLVDRQRQYLRFRRAALVAGCETDPGADDPDRAALCADAVDRYQAVLDALNEGRATPLTFSALASIRNQARGQRDVGVVVVLVAYAVQALDAYVAAELSDFDVSEDLSIRLGVPTGPGAVTARLRF